MDCFDYLEFGTARACLVMLFLTHDRVLRPADHDRQ